MGHTLKMDSLVSKILNLIGNDKILIHRKQQLKIESTIDSKIRENQKKCPQEIIQFFLFQREINRKQITKFEKRISESYAITLENLEEIDQQQSKLLQLIQKHGICDAISLFSKS